MSFVGKYCFLGYFMMVTPVIQAILSAWVEGFITFAKVPKILQKLHQSSISGYWIKISNSLAREFIHNSISGLLDHSSIHIFQTSKSPSVDPPCATNYHGSQIKVILHLIWYETHHMPLSVAFGCFMLRWWSFISFHILSAKRLGSAVWWLLGFKALLTSCFSWSVAIWSMM